MAKASGLSPSAVHCIRPAFTLQAHRTETFKRAVGPLLMEKVQDYPISCRGATDGRV
jgi:hypothetical protein